MVSKIAKSLSRAQIQREVRRILSTIDLDEFKSIQAKYAHTPFGDIKHWDIAQRLAINLSHAHRLGIQHSSKALKVLDIGAGCGYFPYICRFYGHQVIALDLDVPMYKEVVTFLNIDWKQCEVKAYKELPDLGTRFDLVTALLLWFNNPANSRTWSVEEWRFFFNDLAKNQLAPNARVYLSLGNTKDREWSDSRLLAWLKRSGAKIDNGSIYFESVACFPE